MWAARGSARAQVGDRHWVLPPTQALWIPGGEPHDVWVAPGSLLHCLYVGPGHGPSDWAAPTLVAVTPLVRELLLCLAEPAVEGPVSEAGQVLLFGMLEPIGSTAVDLPMPDDERAAELARALLDRPDDPATLREWGQRLAASESTLRRAFLSGTGMTFTEWRTQARLRAALPLLLERMPVHRVAPRVGYASTTGFIDAFRRHFGSTPGAWVSSAGPG